MDKEKETDTKKEWKAKRVVGWDVSTPWMDIRGRAWHDERQGKAWIGTGTEADKITRGLPPRDRPAGKEGKDRRGSDWQAEAPPLYFPVGLARTSWNAMMKSLVYLITSSELRRLTVDSEGA
jgi:hypothetical protein